MTLPFSFPPWLPWWVPVAILVPAILYGLVFLAMPFSVFGVKARLDILEARLDEIQGEIRALVLRLPEPGQESDNVSFTGGRADPGSRDSSRTPPIPPRNRNADEMSRPDRGDPGRRFAAAERFATIDQRRSPPIPPAPTRRSEPRLDWPPGTS